MNNDFHTTVQLVPWTPDWEKRFREERTTISSAFEKAGLPPAQIHHTGSTSIRGMWSKPIIDVLVIIPNDKGYLSGLLGLLPPPLGVPSPEPSPLGTAHATSDASAGEMAASAPSFRAVLLSIAGIPFPSQGSYHCGQ